MTDNRLRWLTLLTLFALYMLVYVPVPDSADGTAILALTTALVRHGNADISIIGADDALFEFDRSRMGAWGVGGALYSKKGIAPSLALIPLVALTEVFPALPLRATAMLFNPLITAATAALLYSLARAFGFRPRTALVTALVYGVATTALVYTKTLYGEPLAALLMVVAVLNLAPQTPLRLRRGGVERSEAGVRSLIAGAALGFATGINLSYLVLAAIAGLYVLIETPRSQVRQVDQNIQENRQDANEAKINHHFLASFASWRFNFLPAVLYTIPILIMLALIAAYNVARFGSPFTSGYYFDAGEGFNKPFLAGAFGLTFSPYRGVFWYAPVLLLAIPGWLWLRRLRPGTAWLLLALVAVQIATYAAWWSWDGGIVWGPRFLLPVLPLIALCLAPVVERVIPSFPLREKGSPIFTEVSHGEGKTGGHNPLEAPHPEGERCKSLLEAPHPEGERCKSLLEAPHPEGERCKSLLEAPRPEGEGFGVRVLRVSLITLTILSIGVQILGALYSYFPYTGVLFSQHAAGEGDSYINQLADEVLFDPSISAIVGHAQMLMQGAPMEPAWLAGGDPTQARAVQLQAALQPPAPALVASAHYGTALLDVRGMPILSMNAPTTPDDPLASRMWAHARNRDLLWYVTWFTPADPLNWQERELWHSAAFAVQREVDGHRALLFQLAPPPPDTTGGWTFGTIRLDAYAVQRRTDGLLVSLAWAAAAAPDGDYGWFVHVLDANGAIIAQQDRAPQGGYAPTSGWVTEQGVTDYLYFPLADATEADALRIGWVDPATGARLPVRDADGGAVEDGFVVVGATPAA